MTDIDRLPGIDAQPDVDVREWQRQTRQYLEQTRAGREVFQVIARRYDDDPWQVLRIGGRVEHSSVEDARAYVQTVLVDEDASWRGSFVSVMSLTRWRIVEEVMVAEPGEEDAIRERASQVMPVLDEAVMRHFGGAS